MVLDIDNKISFLKEDVFNPLVDHIRKRRKSLTEVKRFSNVGIEGWLKVETIAALSEKIKAVQNKGPDLILEGNIEIELKAATGFSLAWIKGGLKYGTACLFLLDGSDRERIKALEYDKSINVIGCKQFNDGKNQWVIGIVEPIRKDA